MIVVEKVIKSELEKVKQLLIENNLPVEDFEDECITFFIAKINNITVGVIGLEQYEATGLLRSLAVKSDYKNLKIGRDLIEYLLRYCKNNSIQELYLLTTTAEMYFEKFGFYKITRENTPTAIKNTKEFALICPATALIMKKILIIH